MELTDWIFYFCNVFINLKKTRNEKDGYSWARSDLFQMIVKYLTGNISGFIAIMICAGFFYNNWLFAVVVGGTDIDIKSKNYYI